MTKAGTGRPNSFELSWGKLEMVTDWGRVTLGESLNC